jgi:hypothetical protein
MGTAAKLEKIFLFSSCMALLHGMHDTAPIKQQVIIASKIYQPSGNHTKLQRHFLHSFSWGQQFMAHFAVFS